ncbi:hypothetical protein NDU88_011430 [Pleurodeles waltl]|uniref:Uncharacterized protein n=1 Tax=Pleurodeles waltl TaxID=8319 RepID=A0AAV7R2Z7_PLEWA|nr:hypothetical protein NDU88_011430 [Pleurodeles waltl]
MRKRPPRATTVPEQGASAMVPRPSKPADKRLTQTRQRMRSRRLICGAGAAGGKSRDAVCERGRVSGLPCEGGKPPEMTIGTAAS